MRKDRNSSALGLIGREGRKEGAGFGELNRKRVKDEAEQKRPMSSGLYINEQMDR